MARGDRLPSESELVTQFGISRMTVNRALRELSEQGRIVRVAAWAALWPKKSPSPHCCRLPTWPAKSASAGTTIAAMCWRWSVSASWRWPLRWICARASQCSIRCAFTARRTASAAGRPLRQPRQVPQFAAQDFTLLQPSEYLVRNVPFDQVEHVVDAVMPSAEQAALLEMPATEPCLLLTRRTWSRGVPITVVRCLHPASRYRLGSRFRADGNPAAG